MSNTFDDLINEFFQTNPKKQLNQSICDMIESFVKIENEEEQYKAVVEKFGEPTEIIEYVENRINVKKIIWDTPEGQFVKISYDKIQLNDAEFINDLKKDLEEAIKLENYDKAAFLRDQIKAFEIEQSK